MNNKDFINLLHEACKNTKTVEEMDVYLNNALYNKIPFDLTFKEVKK